MDTAPSKLIKLEKRGLIMMPTSNLPVPPGAPPGGGTPGGGGGGKPSPEEVKQMLLNVIDKVKQVAAQNGIDFRELIAGSEGNTATPAPPAPTAPVV